MIVGIIPSYVYKELEDYTEVFVVNEKCIQLNDTLTDSYNRTNKINNVLHSLWHEDKFCALKGWRNEVKVILYKNVVICSYTPLIYTVWMYIKL